MCLGSLGERTAKPNPSFLPNLRVKARGPLILNIMRHESKQVINGAHNEGGYWGRVLPYDNV